MFEPKHTGISYSFTADGYYEEAYYRAISNRTKKSSTLLPRRLSLTGRYSYEPFLP
jgi:hypothetical protein